MQHLHGNSTVVNVTVNYNIGNYNLLHLLFTFKAGLYYKTVVEW